MSNRQILSDELESLTSSFVYAQGLSPAKTRRLTSTASPILWETGLLLMGVRMTWHYRYHPLNAIQSHEEVADNGSADPAEMKCFYGGHRIDQCSGWGVIRVVGGSRYPRTNQTVRNTPGQNDTTARGHHPMYRRVGGRYETISVVAISGPVQRSCTRYSYCIHVQAVQQQY